MKNRILGCLSALFFGCHFAGAQTNAPIPWDEIGAKAGAQYRGARLVLDHSGRTLAYSRLRVEYDNWIGISSVPGANALVRAAVADGSGNLYIGGDFKVVGNVLATNIAKWNGSSWSALGSGMDDPYARVNALAVSGSDLYAGGGFTTAGGKVSACVAKAVVYPPVLALEPDGSGGYFIRCNGVPGTASRLQRAPALAGPWASSAPQIAPASGRVEFRDTSPAPGQTFYRAVQP